MTADTTTNPRDLQRWVNAGRIFFESLLAHFGISKPLPDFLGLSLAEYNAQAKRHPDARIAKDWCRRWNDGWTREGWPHRRHRRPTLRHSGRLPVHPARHQSPDRPRPFSVVREVRPDGAVNERANAAAVSIRAIQIDGATPKCTVHPPEKRILCTGAPRCRLNAAPNELPLVSPRPN